MADPGLAEDQCQRLVEALMDARRAVAAAQRAGDGEPNGRRALMSMRPSVRWASEDRCGGMTGRRT